MARFRYGFLRRERKISGSVSVAKFSSDDLESDLSGDKCEVESKAGETGVFKDDEFSGICDTDTFSSRGDAISV